METTPAAGPGTRAGDYEGMETVRQLQEVSEQCDLN